MLGGRRSYSFTDKAQSKDGKLSVIFGVVSIIVLIFLVVCSIVSKGQLGQTYGLAGVVDCFIAFYGLIIAVLGFKEEDTNKSLCISGVLLNAVPLMILIGLFVTGIC